MSKKKDERIKELEDRVFELENLLADAYMWIGVRPNQRPLPKDYQRVMKAAAELAHQRKQAE